MKKESVKLARQFHLACYLKMRSDAHFNQTLFRSISSTEAAEVIQGNYAIAISNIESVFDGDPQARSGSDIMIKTADRLAEILLAKLPLASLAAIVPAEMRSQQAAAQFRELKAPNLARLAVL